MTHKDEINHMIKIDDIIHQHFKKIENIDPDIMSTYIATEHKFINEFNHQVDKVMLDSNQILPSTRQYMDKNADYDKEQDVLKRMTMKNELKKLKMEYKKWIDNEGERKKIETEMEKI